jgi:hypothetical protein
MIRWKYMTAQFATRGLGDQKVVEKLQGNMNVMGEYGWELVSTNVYHNSDIGEDVIVCFYKKPVAEKEK